MKVSAFIKWLEQQDQNLEVSVIESYTSTDYVWDGEDEVRVETTSNIATCFDDPRTQSSTTTYSLILGKEE